MKTSSILERLSNSVRHDGDVEFNASLICRDEDGCVSDIQTAPITDIYVVSSTAFVVDVTQVEKARKKELLDQIESLKASYEAEYYGLKRSAGMDVFSTAHGKLLAAIEILKLLKDA